MMRLGELCYLNKAMLLVLVQHVRVYSPHMGKFVCEVFLKEWFEVKIIKLWHLASKANKSVLGAKCKKA